MVELTEREKTIVHTMNILMNPMTKSAPLDVRVIALKSMLGFSGINAEEDFLKDLTHSVEATMNESMGKGLKFLDKHKESMKGMDFAKMMGDNQS
jgi:hypothetical protein